jgi:hypothetical protein
VEAYRQAIDLTTDTTMAEYLRAELAALPQ